MDFLKWTHLGLINVSVCHYIEVCQLWQSTCGKRVAVSKRRSRQKVSQRSWKTSYLASGSKGKLERDPEHYWTYDNNKYSSSSQKLGENGYHHSQVYLGLDGSLWVKLLRGIIDTLPCRTAAKWREKWKSKQRSFDRIHSNRSFYQLWYASFFG